MDLAVIDTHAHAAGLLAALHEDLRALRLHHAAGPVRRELLARIFRHIHSFKGVVQTAGFQTAGRLAHEMETVLDALRVGKNTLDADTITILENSVGELQRSLQGQSSAGLVAVQEQLQQLPAVPGVTLPAIPTAWAEGLTPHEARQLSEAVAEGWRIVALTVNFDLENLAEDLPALTDKLAADGELLATKPLLPEADDLLAFRLLYATGLTETAVAELVAPFGPCLLETLAHNGARYVLAQEVLGRIAESGKQVAQATGREVTVTITGGAMLWSETIANALYSPLVQIIRNAVLHGIETPAKRRAAGKVLPGQIHLATWLEEGEIVVCVSDDGRGLSPATTVATIFQAGFSTADEVTEWAGRGVGLDIVRHTLDELGGRVEVASEVGRGTSFTLVIPKTGISGSSANY